MVGTYTFSYTPVLPPQKGTADADVQCAMGAELAKMGRTVEACKLFERALQMDPTHPAAAASLMALERVSGPRAEH